jgi:hypothetical protein
MPEGYNIAMDNNYHEKRKSTRRISDELSIELLNRIKWGIENNGLTKEMCLKIYQWATEDK